MQPFEISLIAATALLIAEMFAGAFVFLSFSIALFTVSAAEFLLHGFDLKRDALTFAVVTITSVLTLRIFFRMKGDTKTASVDVNEY